MRATRGIRRLGVCCLLAVIVGLGSPAGGRAQGLPTVDLSSDPWFVGWSELLPPAYMGVNTDSSDICVAGRIECVDRVARRLERQVAGLGCDHNAVFSLAYARTTQQVAAVQRADPAFFSDTPWLNHYDAVFADFYFDAWNSWQRGGSAPRAWTIAFRGRGSPEGVRGRQPVARLERPRQPRSAVHPVRDRPRRSPTDRRARPTTIASTGS